MQGLRHNNQRARVSTFDMVFLLQALSCWATYDEPELAISVPLRGTIDVQQVLPSDPKLN